jgi:hypothetical protein
MHVESDCRKANFNRDLFWSYGNMVKDDGSGYVYGNGRDQNDAPKDGENRFLVGDKGFKFDDSDGVCNDNCGGYIHTGYKFWITYGWDNDDDFY